MFPFQTHFEFTQTEMRNTFSYKFSIGNLKAQKKYNKISKNYLRIHMYTYIYIYMYICMSLIFLFTFCKTTIIVKPLVSKPKPKGFGLSLKSYGPPPHTTPPHPIRIPRLVHVDSKSSLAKSQIGSF